MIDLLVGSLMADGGLESALNAAITAEIQVCFYECVCELTEALFTWQSAEIEILYPCEEIAAYCQNKKLKYKISSNIKYFL